MSFRYVKQARTAKTFNASFFNKKINILPIHFSSVTLVACSSLSLVESETMSL